MKLHRARTQSINTKQLDFMVTHFSSHDSSVLRKLGQHSKELKWKVQPGVGAKTIEITIHVDKSVVTSARVYVMSDKDRIFPTNGEDQSKMVQDFRYHWPFRGTIKGFNEKGFFEMRPKTAMEQWLPAIITEQRSDGLFEVTAFTSDPSTGGMREVVQPAVSVSDIREARTKKPLVVPESKLMLEVPYKDPLHATLSVDMGSGEEAQMITHYFARPSPCLPAGQKAPRVAIDVSKDHKKVTANVGHTVLAHFKSGEVRAVNSDPAKKKHDWTVQLGPFAEHTICVEKKWTSKIVTLLVDGECFVESSAEDIDCESNCFECKFRFVGERCIDMNVFETNSDGVTLDTKGTVVNRTKYTHECVVSVQDLHDLSSATLTVDGNDFLSLPVKPEPHQENNLEMDVKAMELHYGLVVPYKVNESAPAGAALMAKKLTGFFGCCGGAGNVSKDTELVEK